MIDLLQQSMHTLSGITLLALLEVKSFSEMLPAIDMKFFIIVPIVTIIIISFFSSIISLNSTIIHSHKKELGLINDIADMPSKWELWKTKLTDIVPVESEATILLDHEYDDIKELDNNLPPWWLYGFYLSIVFGIGYLGYYHYYDLGHSSEEAYEYEMEMAQIEVDKYLEKQANNIDENNLIALEDAASIQAGAALFNTNCIACHLKGGGGSPVSVGPNLTDKYWLHGNGDIAGIFKTIKYGVPEKGMIAWKAQLKPADIHKIASYIMSIQDSNPPNAKAPQGKLVSTVTSSNKSLLAGK